ncbi:hypothetical protein GCM10028857_13650 [Salinarchaeum chitinilyticum]
MAPGFATSVAGPVLRGGPQVAGQVAQLLLQAQFGGVFDGVPRTTETATLVAFLVTASLPFYLYGAWIVIDAEVVTWSVLMHHLRYIAVGLLLTTVPVLTWMVPRLLEGFTGTTAVHVFFGLQAYALLLFALTGIFHIFRAKRAHSLYEDPDQDVDIGELHENMSAWRFRLRVGVFGYLLTWIIAWLLGMLLLFKRWAPLLF